MSDNISKIDQQILEAKARKATKDSVSGETATRKPKLSGEDKAARTLAKETAKLAAKAERDEKRAAKKALKASSGRLPHTLKVERARAKLPSLSQNAAAAYDNLTIQFTSNEIAALSAHLAFFNREKSTELASKSSNQLKVGDTVTVTSGDPRWIGMTGEVVKAQRIRIYCQLPNGKKPAYMFSSDVQLVTSKSSAKTG